MTTVTTTLGVRVHRARREHLRQELLAPAAALAGWAELLREDAVARGLHELCDDLDHVHRSALELHDLIAAFLGSARGAAASAARIRHELRTPLNAVKGYAELILEGAGARAAPLADDLRKIMTEADRLVLALNAIALFPADAEDEAPSDPDPGGTIAHLMSALDTGDRTGRESGRILVVDDNASSRDLLVRRLTRDGHTALAAATGREALARLEGEPVDLVLLDLVLPDIDGYRMLRRLKRMPATREVPVLIVTGLDAVPSAVRCIEAGAEDYLRKPVSPVLMRARIEACLERKRWRDRERAYLAELETEKRRAKGLLANILPAAVAARLERGETQLAERVGAVSVLFADLVGFTALSARLPAAELVAMLNRVYTAFDALTLRCGVEKIKTLGDCYMAAAGLPDPCPDHAARAADLALGMLPAVERVGRELGLPLSVRVGIHSGPAVAGILGTHKFNYDLWGETVNTAARLEQHGAAGRIQVSAATADLLRDRYRLVRRGCVAVKGMGAVETWFLERRGTA